MYRRKEIAREYSFVRGENKKVWRDIESQIKKEVFEMQPEKHAYSGLFQVLEPVEGTVTVQAIT